MNKIVSGKVERNEEEDKKLFTKNLFLGVDKIPQDQR